MEAKDIFENIAVLNWAREELEAEVLLGLVALKSIVVNFDPIEDNLKRIHDFDHVRIVKS